MTVWKILLNSSFAQNIRKHNNEKDGTIMLKLYKLDAVEMPPILFFSLLFISKTYLLNAKDRIEE